MTEIQSMRDVPSASDFTSSPLRNRLRLELDSAALDGLACPAVLSALREYGKAKATYDPDNFFRRNNNSQPMA